MLLLLAAPERPHEIRTMIHVPLPSEPERLQELANLCSWVDCEISSLLGTLRAIEASPKPIPPTRVYRVPGVGIGISQVLTPAAQINTSLQAAAKAVIPVLEYLDLQPDDRLQINSVAFASEVGPGEGSVSSTAPATDLLLHGLVEFEDTPPPEEPDLPSGNALRVKVLVGLFDRLRQATSTLHREIHTRLCPPCVRDRVQVDITKGIVTVDGTSYSVPDRQAVLFKYLRDANGAPVSSALIARREGLKEFKATRILRQLKYPELAAIIQTSKRGSRGFYLCLPPMNS